MANDQLIQLLEKYSSNTCTPEERQMVESWLKRYEERPDTLPAAEDLKPQYDAMFSKIAHHLDLKPEPLAVRKNSFRKFYKFAAAASVIIAVALIYLFYPSLKKPAPQVSSTKQIINKATLTLADGTTIALEEAMQGELATQGGVKVIKLDNGILSYQGNAPTGNNELYNTITTPRGSQYQIVLPDGTHVWLNAASSLRFPASKSTNRRIVALSGEAYFEVQGNKDVPFMVEAAGTEITVLGTSFNVMAYKEEPFQTATLIEGSVKINHGSQSRIMKPGEESNINNRTGELSLGAANPEKTLAWKEGEFRFEKLHVPAIMRQIQRWYDVDIKYKGDFSDVALSGIISREEDLSGLLKILKATRKLDFEVEGREITVIPFK